MEVTNAHARQALPLSLMEKPVIMVRFKRGRGGGGGGEAVLRKPWRGRGGRQYKAYVVYSWIIGIRKRHQALLPPLRK